MSDAVLLAAIAVVASLVSGGLVKAIGAWADARGRRTDAMLAASVVEQSELARVRMEYLGRIERLEKRLDEKDAELRALGRELSDARVVVAQQAARITDLEQDLAALRREREERR